MGNFKHLNRESYFEIAESRLDENHQLGYDYSKDLLKRSVSGYLYGDAKREAILQKFNDLLVYLVDSVKYIKKTFMFTYKKNSRKLN